MDQEKNTQFKTHSMWYHFDHNYGPEANCSCGWNTRHAREKIVRRKMERHHNKTGHDIKGNLKASKEE